MFKALTGLIDGFFKPINAFFSKLLGAPTPPQGGNVLAPEVRTGGKWVSGVAGWVWIPDNLFVDRLPDFVTRGAPTSLTPLSVPLAQQSIPTGPAPIGLAKNESAKEA